MRAVYDLFKEQVDKEAAQEIDEADYMLMQEKCALLTPDEQIAVLTRFGKRKPEGSRRMYKNIINDLLNEAPKEAA